MADLSPAAQAVLDAFWEGLNCGDDWEQENLAAALQAAADQIKPNLTRTPWLTNENGYFNETFENMEALGEMNAYRKLLAIAAELEGVNG